MIMRELMRMLMRMLMLMLMLVLPLLPRDQYVKCGEVVDVLLYL